MALTERAKAWLATLSRETPLPTATVERLIIDAGHRPHRRWLEFHEAFAGYIEEVGPGDIAIWGLARAGTAALPTTWCPANSVFIRPKEGDFPESIACADAHPVHGYELGADGFFGGIGGPVSSFEMKLERHGVMKAFFDRGKAKQTLMTKHADEPEHQQLLSDMASSLVPEASNDWEKFYLEPKRLLRFHPIFKQMILLELTLD